MSNKHFIKGMRRRARKMGLGRVGHSLSGSIADYIRQKDADALALARVRPEDKARAAKAAQAAHRATASEKSDKELARLVQQDAKRRQKVAS